MGSVHDFTIFKEVFKQFYFSQYNILVDLGFLAVDKYITPKKLQMSHKKPKGGELTEIQKLENCTKSRFRVVAENTIAMLKRYFILCIESCSHIKNKLNEVIEMCGLLWNLKET